MLSLHTLSQLTLPLAPVKNKQSLPQHPSRSPKCQTSQSSIARHPTTSSGPLALNPHPSPPPLPFFPTKNTASPYPPKTDPTLSLSQLRHPPRQHYRPILHQRHSRLPRPSTAPIRHPPSVPHPRLLRPANRPHCNNRPHIPRTKNPLLFPRLNNNNNR